MEWVWGYECIGGGKGRGVPVGVWVHVYVCTYV